MANIRRADLPTCAKACIDGIIAETTCSQLDNVCLCQDASFIAAAHNCYSTYCNAADAQVWLQWDSSNCAALGYSFTAPATVIPLPLPTYITSVLTSVVVSVTAAGPSPTGSSIPTSISTPQTSPGGLPGGAKAGIAIGVIVVVLLAIFLAFLFWRQRRRKPNTVRGVRYGTTTVHEDQDWIDEKKVKANTKTSIDPQPMELSAEQASYAANYKKVAWSPQREYSARKLSPSSADAELAVVVPAELAPLASATTNYTPLHYSLAEPDFAYVHHMVSPVAAELGIPPNEAPPKATLLQLTRRPVLGAQELSASPSPKPAAIFSSSETSSPAEGDGIKAIKKINNRWNDCNERSLIYDVLDSSKSEIRLLHARRSDSGDIECDLTRCSLNKAPKYYALSYVWGDPAVTSNILVNGKTFAATINLVAALEHVIVNLDNSFIWVDAICINQGDINERNSQVQMMTSIFKKAYSVLGWLGQEQDHSTEVIEIIRQMAREITSSGVEIGVEIFSRPADQELLKRLNSNLSGRSLLSLALPRAKDFGRLLADRPFWKRAWILQEMVLAERLAFVCGQTAFTHYDLQNVWAWLSLIVPPAKPASLEWGDWISFKIDMEKGLNVTMAGFTPILRSKETLHEHGPYIAAWDVLTHSWPFAATDPRDKIYSLLGLIDIGIKADYSKFPEMVYRQVADIMFCRVPHDEWLARAGMSIDNRMPALATWVVDWNALSKGDQQVTVCGDLYKANSGMSNLSKTTKISGQSLTIYGILCDEIEFLAPFPGDTDLNAKEAFKFDLTGGLPEGEVLYTLIPPGIPRAQASFRLCLDDIDLYEKRRYILDTSFLSLAMHYLQLLQLADSQGLAYTYENDPAGFTNLLLGEHPSTNTYDTVTGGDGPVNEPDKKPALWLRYPSHYARSRHFYTRKGYIGHAPKCLQKGDLICVLQDCRVPVILRKVGGYYQFVSTCLVLGLMDGEAAQFLKQGKVSMQRFTIH